MKIAYIAAGAGNMYCGTCLHDNTLASALIKKGHQVAMVPTYTPVRTDEEGVSIDRIFYGGINIFLDQKFSWFRHMPRPIADLLDRRSLLNWVSRFSSSTDAKDLGPLTISVLKGEEGAQRKELEKLVEWLRDSYKPQLVHLTNSMFAGFARMMRNELKVPVICSLQGEDLFLQELVEPYRSDALQVLRSRARDIQAFISPSKYYADFMSGYLEIPREKISVVPLGLNLGGHGAGPKKTDDNFVIGYFARICPEKGLHKLIEACEKIEEPFVLKVAGYLAKKDEPYFQNLLKRIEGTSLKDRFQYIGEVDRAGKIEFLNSLSVLSVPTVYREPKGLYILEALANSVPVVQPAHGAFPELIEATGGGLLVEPGNADSLADGLRKLMKDQDLRMQLGKKGSSAVEALYTDQILASHMLIVYEKVLEAKPVQI